MMNAIARFHTGSKVPRASSIQKVTPKSQQHVLTTRTIVTAITTQMKLSKPCNIKHFDTNIILKSFFISNAPKTRAMSTVKDHIWSPRASDGQKELTYMLEELFPDVEIQIDYKNPEFVYSKSKRQIEFDIYIPQYNLMVDFYGREHYIFHWRYGPSEPQKQRDQEKKEMMKKTGITYVVIPVWWDGTKTALMATLHKYRPDLVPDPGSGQPISEKMPEKLEKRLSHNPVPPDPVPYHIMSCEQKGGFPMCRGCKRVFTDRQSLRVVVEGSYNRKYGLQPATYSFCLDTACIKKAIEEPNSLANIPPFDGKIHIPEALLHRASEIPTLNGVTWIKGGESEAAKQALAIAQNNTSS